MQEALWVLKVKVSAMALMRCSLQGLGLRFERVLQGLEPLPDCNEGVEDCIKGLLASLSHNIGDGISKRALRKLSALVSMVIVGLSTSTAATRREREVCIGGTGLLPSLLLARSCGRCWLSAPLAATLSLIAEAVCALDRLAGMEFSTEAAAIPRLEEVALVVEAARLELL
jgi:hypothetical protein